MLRFAPIVAALALAALFAPQAIAQAAPPPLPRLTAEQSARVDAALAQYRADVEARVARGDLLRSDADRLLAWHQWQLAQQQAGLAPPPEILDRQAETDRMLREMPPPVVYGPPPPYFYPPVPYAYAPYWAGPPFFGSVCIGGGRHHFGGVACF